MTRFRRRLLVGVAMVLLFLAGLGGWFYFALYGSTYAALAEPLTVYVSSNDRALLMGRIVNRTRNFHNFSPETPEFFDDLYLRLTNPSLPRSRSLYRLRTPDGAAYWVPTGGR